MLSAALHALRRTTLALNGAPRDFDATNRLYVQGLLSLAWPPLGVLLLCVGLAVLCWCCCGRRSNDGTCCARARAYALVAAALALGVGGLYLTAHADVVGRRALASAHTLGARTQNASAALAALNDTTTRLAAAVAAPPWPPSSHGAARSETQRAAMAECVASLLAWQPTGPMHVDLVTMTAPGPPLTPARGWGAAVAYEYTTAAVVLQCMVWVFCAVAVTTSAATRRATRCIAGLLCAVALVVIMLAGAELVFSTAAADVCQADGGLLNGDCRTADQAAPQADVIQCARERAGAISDLLRFALPPGHDDDATVALRAMLGVARDQTRAVLAARQCPPLHAAATETMNTLCDEVLPPAFAAACVHGAMAALLVPLAAVLLRLTPPPGGGGGGGGGDDAYTAVPLLAM